MQLRLGQILDFYGPQRIKHVLLLPDIRLAYVAVPKAACSSMKLYFERVHQNDPALEKPQIHRDLTVPTLDQFKARDLRDLEQKAPFFGFSVVRDPMRRIVSAYTDKMRDPHFRAQINAALGRDDPDQKVGFGKFLAGIEAQTSRQMNPHWRPQTDLLMMDVLEYDHICRLENLASDLDYLCAATDLPRLKMPHQNKIKESAELVPTPAQRTRIYNLYQSDFEAFEY